MNETINFMIDETLVAQHDYYGYLNTILTKKSQFYQPYRPSNAVDVSPCELIAFYLPQFHPVPLNEAAWGRGFTEWTQITKAQPFFYGHYQPHLPADLGFYDLRLLETLRAQAALAKNYGVSGFCFYYYWFSGQRLMDGPLEMLHQNKDIDIKYCLMWANESWSKRWIDEQEVIIAQRHDSKIDCEFIHSIIPYLKDNRYLRYEGKPVISIYRQNLMTDRSAIDYWRQACRDAGLGEILIMSVPGYGTVDDAGLDGVLQFPPSGDIQEFRVKGAENASFFNKKFEGYLKNPAICRDRFMQQNSRGKPVFRGAFTMFDSSPRFGNQASIYVNTSPDFYGNWLVETIRQSRRDAANRQAPMTPVFINAWNEWAEGAHLEPCRWYGHAFLEATRKALALA
jgi:O-antigen biosynthesis protein